MAKKGKSFMGNNMKITELDRYLFGQGTHYEIYKLLGAHPGTQRKKEGVFFAVWAPHAKAVSVVGNFNDWDPEANVMNCDNDMGIRSEEHTSELQSRFDLVCRLLLEKKK